MNIKIESFNIPDILLIIPDIFKDERGFFMETFRNDVLDLSFKQNNHSGSVKNVIRGLHYQWDPPMGKLMRVTKGIL